MTAQPPTLITPLRLSARPRDALRRLARLLRATSPCWRIVVVDDTADAGLRRRVAALVARRDGALHLPHPETADAPFSIGRLRDAGARAAADGPILFHDVDFFAPPAVYRRLAAALSGPLADDLAHGGFLCAPVAFLTPAGSALFGARGATAMWPLLDSPGARRARLVDRVVRASSAMAMLRRTLLEAGGHDPAFTGHGAEDFELMHRLATAWPRGVPPADYAVDGGARGAGGFRAYFARYAAPLAASGVTLAHRWHPPRREDSRYYAARGANFARLAAALATKPDA